MCPPAQKDRMYLAEPKRPRKPTPKHTRKGRTAQEALHAPAAAEAAERQVAAQREAQAPEGHQVYPRPLGLLPGALPCTASPHLAGVEFASGR